MIRILLLSIAAIFCCNAFSQKFDNVWVFGDSAILDFSTTIPSYNISSIYGGYEANASISDSAGDLLFYTNGEKVWNKNHEVMPNGDSLEIGQISNAAPGSSITQGVIILPKPGSNHLYYIFHMQYFNTEDHYFGLDYSIVDGLLDFGKGNLIEKNTHFFSDTTQEKMHAVKHANGRDWWLLCRSQFQVSSDPEIYTLKFTKFLITPDEISGPYYQFIEPDWEYLVSNGIGQMIFNREGNKMAYPTSNEETSLYDFDRCTGELSNYRKINTGSYGVSFSPNSSKLYLSNTSPKKLYQFCLDCGEPIDSTKTLIYEGPDGNYDLGQHMLGPDNKIYIATPKGSYPNSTFSSINQNLCVINKPDEFYPTCDFDTNTISLGSRRTMHGLPNMPNFNLGKLEGSPCDTITAIAEIVKDETEFTLYPNPAGDYFYIDGNFGEIDKFDVFIYDMDGKIVFEKNNINKQTSIDISMLMSGIYTIKIHSASANSFVNKLIVFNPNK